MRLLRLDLRAFGPFTDVALDLIDGQHGLHILYGPNEAGKSSALRALRQLFYGIDERTQDDFLHAYDKLRVGARLRHSDGSQLEFLRRKAHKQNLRGPDDVALVEAEELQRFLGGVDRAIFETMFGIDHPGLIRGGQEILQGGGELGRLLFAAGSGITELRAVQDNLNKELKELYAERGKNPRLNRVMQELRAAQETVKNAQLSSEEWARREQALSAALARADAMREEQKTNRQHLHRLKRLRDALPALQQRQELLDKLAEHRDALLLPEDFSERRRNLQETMRLAEQRGREAEMQLTEIDTRLRAVHVNEKLCARADAIEEMQRRLGEYRKAQRDRPERQSQCQGLEAQARDILRGLGRADELDVVKSLRLRPDETITIHNLGSEFEGIRARCENANQEVAKNRRLLDLGQRDLEGLQSVPNLSRLRQALKAAHQDGSVERDLNEALEEQARLEKQVALEAARFSGGQGSLADLARMSVPAVETVDRFEADLTRAGQAAAEASQRRREAEAALAAIERDLRQLELQHAVPSEREVMQARRERDAAWQKIVQALTQRTSEPSSLTRPYEELVRRADELADRLRREAERVARKAELLTQHEERQAALKKIEQDQSSTERCLAEFQQAWLESWQTARVAPRSPREMRAWLRTRQEIVQKVEQAREFSGRAARLQQRRDSHCRQLLACLEDLGDILPEPDSSLSVILEAGHERLEHFEGVQARHEQIAENLATRKVELHTAEQQARQAEAERAAWSSRWSEFMARLGLPADTPPAAANAVVAAINDLFQRLREAEECRRRLDELDAAVAQFTGDVQALAGELAPDLATLDCARGAQELATRLTQARAAHQERESLRRQRDQEAARLRQAQAEAGEARAQLELLCREASCGDPAELPGLERRSTSRRQLETALAQIESQLLPLRAGRSLDAFLEEARSCDADALEGEMLGREEREEALTRQLAEVNQTIGQERSEYQRMSGSAAAAEAAEQVESLLAQIQDQAEHFIVLRLASAALQQGIERYRTRHQGPVLARASTLFAGLTRGAYSGLQIDHNERGEAVLLGKRGDETVAVQAMSDGTRDQLYLALRLATLEAYLARHEPLPFVVDDILLNFDDDRAVAALQALAELSERTQVLFFTHHHHLVELARANLPKKVVFVHYLNGRPHRNGSLF